MQRKPMNIFESGSILLNDQYFTWVTNYLKELSQRKMKLTDRQTTGRLIFIGWLLPFYEFAR